MVINRVLGLDLQGALGASVEAYAGRHLVVESCGLLGVFAVGRDRPAPAGLLGLGLVSAGP